MSALVVTESDLLDAYREANLERLGISFEQALQTPAIRQSMSGQARARHMWAQNTLKCGRSYLERIEPQERGQ